MGAAVRDAAHRRCAFAVHVILVLTSASDLWNSLGVAVSVAACGSSLAARWYVGLLESLRGSPAARLRPVETGVKLRLSTCREHGPFGFQCIECKTTEFAGKP